MHDVEKQTSQTRYEILKLLGAGAAGEVYLAFDLKNSRKIVIKCLKAEAASSPVMVERFKNEFSALKTCFHKNIVRVYDFHEVQNVANWFSSSELDIAKISAHYFFTMEFIPGAPLKDIIYTENKKPDFEDSMALLFQIAKGLDYIHKKKLFHRDLKPDNIFISDSGEAKILDFGIAKFEDSDLNLTIQSDGVGTSYYMSPEQIKRQAVDHRADIYAFGVLAYELLTGQKPFDSESRMDLYLKHLAADVPSACKANPELPAWIDTLVATCTQKEKDYRYQEMEDVVALLKARCPFLVDEDDKAKDETKEGNWKQTEKRLAREGLKKRFAITGKQAFLAVLLTFTFWIAWMSPLGHWSTAQVLRTLFTIRGPIPAPENVELIAIDDITYQRLAIDPKMPMPRKLAAKLLEKVHATKPKVVIIDGWFNKVNNEYLPKETHNEEADAALERAIGLGPTTLARFEKENTAIPKAQRNDSNKVIFGSDPRFSRQALMELPMVGNAMGGYISYIGVKIYKDDLPINERVPIRAALEAVGVDAAEPGRLDLVNFYGEPGSIIRKSMVDVLEGDYSFKDKVVLMGFQSLHPNDAPGSFDVHSGSGSWQDYYGVEIHATIVGNLLDNSYIKRLPIMLENWLFWVISGLTFALILVLNPMTATKLYFAVAICWAGATLASFLLWNTYIPGVFLFSLFGLPALGIAWYFYAKLADADLKQAEEMTNIEFRKKSGWNK